MSVPSAFPAPQRSVSRPPSGRPRAPASAAVCSCASHGQDGQPSCARACALSSASAPTGCARSPQPLIRVAVVWQRLDFRQRQHAALPLLFARAALHGNLGWHSRASRRQRRARATAPPRCCSYLLQFAAGLDVALLELSELRSGLRLGRHWRPACKCARHARATGAMRRAPLCAPQVRDTCAVQTFRQRDGRRRRSSLRLGLTRRYNVHARGAPSLPTSTQQQVSTRRKAIVVATRCARA